MLQQQKLKIKKTCYETKERLIELERLRRESNEEEMSNLYNRDSDYMHRREKARKDGDKC